MASSVSLLNTAESFTFVIILFLNIRTIYCIPSTTKGSTKSAFTCEVVENVFQNRGIMANEIPRRPLQGKFFFF